MIEVETPANADEICSSEAPEESSVDLFLEYDFDLPDTTQGRDLAVLLERRDIWGSSFAFRTAMGSEFQDLEPQEDRIVRTVKREKDYLKIPFMVKMIPLFKVLPAAWVDWMVALTGTNKAMDHFTGH